MEFGIPSQKIPNEKNITIGKSIKKNFLYSKIESMEDAMKVIKDTSKGFLALAAIQIALGFLINAAAIIDGVVCGILAILLWKLNSRVVAIIFLLFSLTAIVATGINKFGGGSGGRNIFLALFMTWVSIRAIQATFIYNKLNKLPKL